MESQCIYGLVIFKRTVESGLELVKTWTKEGLRRPGQTDRDDRLHIHGLSEGTFVIGSAIRPHAALMTPAI
jgi:hypothetical protein